MDLSEIKKRFAGEIELRAYDDKYIDRNEEREILQIALQMGITIDSARLALAQVAESKNFVLESVVQKTIKEQVEAAMGDDGKVDRKEFDLIVESAKVACKGAKKDRDLQKMVITLMEDTGRNSVKTGWFSDWYANLKRELGMTA